MSIWRYRAGDPVKTIEIELPAFRVLAKYAAKRGLFETHTPTQALTQLFEEFKVIEKC